MIVKKLTEKLQATGWAEPLSKALSDPSFIELGRRISEARKVSVIYPAKLDVFNAFLMTPFDRVRVVILGQDPYHGPGQANGLAFAVNNGQKIPPSLKNIFKEIEFDLQTDMTGKKTDLTGWASQGVLLLNTSLTVEAGKPGSHSKIGWQFFTDAVIQAIANRPCKQVFFLWGNHAQEKLPLIPRNQYNKIMVSAHPSPLSVKGFFGQRHFSEANKFLGSPIDWSYTSTEEETLDDFFAGIK